MTIRYYEIPLPFLRDKPNNEANIELPIPTEILKKNKILNNEESTTDVEYLKIFLKDYSDVRC